MHIWRTDGSCFQRIADFSTASWNLFADDAIDGFWQHIYFYRG